MPVPVIIDTDCGIDDAVAIWWALTNPDVEVLGFTVVHGNVEMETAGINTCRLLELADRADLPVANGATLARPGAPHLNRADFIHGTDGVGNTGRTAALRPGTETSVELLRRLVHERPGEIVVVTLGPMTNIADVIDADPDWAPAVARLVVMGGVVLGPGNAFPVAEANIAHDPPAAAISFAAPWAQPPLLVGLDVTQTATLRAVDVALAHEGRTPAAIDLADLLDFYRRFGGTFCADGEFPSHDALAMMAAVIPGLVTGPVLPMAVHVDTGPAQGMTVVDRREPFFAKSGQYQGTPDGFHRCEIGLDVDVDRFRAEVRALFGETSTARE